MMTRLLTALAALSLISCGSLEKAGYNVSGEICHEDYGCVSLDSDKNIKIKPKAIEGGSGKWSVKINPEK